MRNEGASTDPETDYSRAGGGVVSDWFTDEELERIARFAESPKHSRTPRMLLPDDEEGEPEPGHRDD